MNEAAYCDCAQPFWHQHPDGTVVCKRCGRGEGFTEVTPTEEPPPHKHDHNHKKARS